MLEKEARPRFFYWQKLRQDEIDHELIWLSTTAGSIAIGYLWLRMGRALPPCVFHALTGLPCPTCGSTRATMKLLAGDIAAAFPFNPLFVLALGVVGAYCIYAAVVLAWRLPRLRIGHLPSRARQAIRWTAVAILLGNWGWLIYRGV